MINDKLNRKENEVMRAIFVLSEGKERFLISPYDLTAFLPSKANYNEETLERTLRALELDGYFDFVPSDRKGEKMYVIHMREAGLAFERSDTQRKRSVYFRWGVAAVGAVITFLIGLVLKLIFQ